MLKDRRVLLEQQMVKQKQACGTVYQNIVLGRADMTEGKMYESMKLKLTDMVMELAIVDQMIADGHE